MARAIRKYSRFEQQFERFQALFTLDENDEPSSDLAPFYLEGKDRKLTELEKQISRGGDEFLSISNLFIRSGGIY